MSDLNEVCKSIVDEVSDALCAALVDLSSGLLLAAHHNSPYFSQAYLDTMAAVAADMFRGAANATVGKMLSGKDDASQDSSIQEIQLSTDHTYHFMSVVPGKEDCMMLLITGRNSSLGMGWAALRRELAAVAPLCP